MAWLTENLFWFFFLGIVGYFIFRMVRYGGFKSAMFGAKIEKTLGEVEGQRQALLSSRLKVHLLEGGPSEKAVGIELVAKGVASYQMMPITLSAAEAKRLVSLLQSAIAS
ncbi:hypothetical protein [Ideonella sp. B508-1]|uniref:hypothetical protein n=1 Tax=Ideonella sp. B508-1 TaxID=137716 RepID=UPI0011D239FA|nr:hypothetical protein [Ideonella sp. B508-1]